MINLLIKKYRLSNNLTQSECSDRADVSMRFFQDIEANRRKPSLETLYRIAKVLNVNISDLIEDDIK